MAAHDLSSPAPSPDTYDLVVAGGGAAGFFGAVTYAEKAPGHRVLILEKSREVLGKVKISGGGRCNVTHACFDPRALVQSYPRGAKQLIGPFHRWGPQETVEWFEQRGVPLKTEADGRMFPESNRSQSVIDCLIQSARDAAIEVRRSTAVKAAIATPDGLFHLTLGDGTQLECTQLLLTLGGIRTPIGAELARGFGHHIEPAAPSLFTFKINDVRLEGLQGLSVADADVSIAGSKLRSRGPVLITHWGLSGPGILRISAWGARELHRQDYRFEVVINWCGTISRDELLEVFAQKRISASRKKVINDTSFGIPSRLWKRLVVAAAGESQAENLLWPHLSKDMSRKLAEQLGACRLQVDGKSMNKDEFVTCGGVSLREVDFKTMESRQTKNLYFAGEILDIDGITGGFNFQAAWTTSRIAGEAMAQKAASFITDDTDGKRS